MPRWLKIAIFIILLAIFMWLLIVQIKSCGKSTETYAYAESLDTESLATNCTVFITTTERDNVLVVALYKGDELLERYDNVKEMYFDAYRETDYFLDSIVNYTSELSLTLSTGEEIIKVGEQDVDFFEIRNIQYQRQYDYNKNEYTKWRAVDVAEVYSGDDYLSNSGVVECEVSRFFMASLHVVGDTEKVPFVFTSIQSTTGGQSSLTISGWNSAEIWINYFDLQAANARLNFALGQNTTATSIQGYDYLPDILSNGTYTPRGVIEAYCNNISFHYLNIAGGSEAYAAYYTGSYPPDYTDIGTIEVTIYGGYDGEEIIKNTVSTEVYDEHMFDIIAYKHDVTSIEVTYTANTSPPPIQSTINYLGGWITKVQNPYPILVNNMTFAQLTDSIGDITFYSYTFPNVTPVIPQPFFRLTGYLIEFSHQTGELWYTDSIVYMEDSAKYRNMGEIPPNATRAVITPQIEPMLNPDAIESYYRITLTQSIREQVYNSAYNAGYNKAVEDLGGTTGNAAVSFFSSIASILGVQVFPNFTIGSLLTFIVGMGLLAFVIKFVRG